MRSEKRIRIKEAAVAGKIGYLERRASPIGACRSSCPVPTLLNVGSMLLGK